MFSEGTSYQCLVIPGQRSFERDLLLYRSNLILPSSQPTCSSMLRRIARTGVAYVRSTPVANSWPPQVTASTIFSSDIMTLPESPLVVSGSPPNIGPKACSVVVPQGPSTRVATVELYSANRISDRAPRNLMYIFPVVGVSDVVKSISPVPGATA